MEQSSAWFKIAIFFVMLSLVVYVVGFSLPKFFEETCDEWNKTSIGLWQYCIESRENRGETNCQYADWSLGVKVGQCIGLALTVLTLLVSFKLLVTGTNKLWRAIISMACFGAHAAVGVSTGIAIFYFLAAPVRNQCIQKLGISSYSCIATTIGMLIAWGLLKADNKKMNIYAQAV